MAYRTDADSRGKGKGLADLRSSVWGHLDLSRVSLGGHDVPELDIRRRFKRSIRNFWHVYRELADFWSIVYNAGPTPENVAFGDSTSCIIRIEELFELYRTIRDTDD